MKILILVLGRIGDMVLTTPMFRAIKEKYPDAQVDVIASRHNISIPQQDVHVNKVILLNNSPEKFFKALWQIRKTKYDFYIDPKEHYSWHSKFIAHNARAKKKIWLAGKEASTKNIDVSTLNPNNYLHFTELALVALAPLGIEYKPPLPRPQLCTHPSSETYATDFLRQHNIQDFVLVNISSGKKGMESRRCWQNDKWNMLIKKLHEDGFTVLLNAINEEREIAKQMAAKTGNVFVPACRNINDAVSFTKRAAFVISPDTSLVHISAAFNKPLIAMYSSHDANTLKFYPSNSVREVLVPKNKSCPVGDIEACDMLQAYKKIAGFVKEKMQEFSAAV